MDQPETQPPKEDIDQTQNDVLSAPRDDEHMSSEEAQLAEAFAPAKRGFWRRAPSSIKQLINRWWRNKRIRYGTLSGLVALVFILFLVPVTRYGLLNAVGMRGNVEMRIVDSTTNVPLPDVRVALGGQESMSGRDGRVQLSRVRLGRQTLKLHKEAFADTEQVVTVGLGTLKLEPAPMKPTGARYKLLVVDYVTGKPVPGSYASSQSASASADANGLITLTVNRTSSPLEVMIHGDGYRAETVTMVTHGQSPQNVQLVPVVKHVFISNRDGTPALFSIDLDGKNITKLLGDLAAPRQMPMMQLSRSTDLKYVAVVSKKGMVRDSDGYPLDTLSLVTVTGGDKVINRGESITVIGWRGSTLVYQLVVGGASAANPTRSRLMSYDITSGKQMQLASANYFAGSYLIGDQLYYAISATDPVQQSALMQISLDGTNKQLLVKKTIWGVYRNSLSELYVQTNKNWLRYNVITHNVDGADADFTNLIFALNPDNSRALTTVVRDGLSQPALLDTTDTAAKLHVLDTDKNVISAGWLGDDMLLLHVSSNGQMTDYVMSVSGEPAKAITDVYPQTYF